MTPESPKHADLFTVLSAVTIKGPDSGGMFWIAFRCGGTEALLSLTADSTGGQAVVGWRDMQSAALAKALLTKASQTDS